MFYCYTGKACYGKHPSLLAHLEFFEENEEHFIFFITYEFAL